MKKCLAILLALALLHGAAIGENAPEETAAEVTEETIEETIPGLVIEGLSEEEYSVLELDSLSESLVLSWEADGISKYWVYLLDEAADDSAEDGEPILSGVIFDGTISIPKERLESGKRLKVVVKGVFTYSEKGSKSWLIRKRSNYLGSVEEALSIVDSSRTAIDVTAGRVRRVAQNRSDKAFTRSYWESKKYNFVYGGEQLSNSMCTRAAYSMALSYLGVSVTPVEMSQISGSKQVDHDPAAPYDAITAYLAKQNGVQLTRIKGELSELFENYASDSSYSPVYVRMRKKDGNPHAFIVVGRDDTYYYAVDSSARDGQFVHAIRVNDTEDLILKDRGASCWEKYYNAKITYCHQWKLDPAQADQ